jgi:hypothetical protein
VQKKNKHSPYKQMTGRKLLGEEEVTYVQNTQIKHVHKKNMKLQTCHVPLICYFFFSATYYLILKCFNYYYYYYYGVLYIELAQIVECMKDTGLTVLPIFYHVDPSHVRNQTETFAEAFASHGKDLKADIKMMQKWRAALRQVWQYLQMACA